MDILWQALPFVQNFFQLNFLFSGLEVSSTTVLMGRAIVLILLGGGLLWAVFKLVMKLLDCCQTLLANLGQIPWVFSLLLLLVVPWSPESLGSKWIGYILIVLALVSLALCSVLAVAVWKYGVDQALRLINRFGAKQESPPIGAHMSGMPPENILTPFSDSAGVRM
jgi:hypothetical protein